MFSAIFSRLFSLLSRIPLRIWGFSVLCSFICLISSFSLLLLPIVAMLLSIALQFGMKSIYLSAYRDDNLNDIKAEQLFFAFGKGRFFRILGGMLWMHLWTFIWQSISTVIALIFSVMASIFGILAHSEATTTILSILGFGFIGCALLISIIKSLSYRFTPYILATDDEISPTNALKKSMEMTKGFKGSIFLCDLFIPVCFLLLAAIVGGVLFLLAKIPVIGSVFGILLALWIIFAVLFTPLLLGFMDAGYFVEAQNIRGFRAAPTAPTYTAPTYTAPKAPTYTAPTYTAPTAPTYTAPTYTAPTAPTYTAPTSTIKSTYTAPTYSAPVPQTIGVTSARSATCPACGEPIVGMFCKKCGRRNG